jgi:glutathione synthase/RimK-type ligase-like ATP-grasp enzyme
MIPPTRGGIVIVAHHGDEHADRVQFALEHRGVLVHRLSNEDLPARRFVWSPIGNFVLGRSRVEPVAGLWRRPSSPRTSGIDEEYEQFVDAECRDALEGALSAASIRWVTAPESLARAERKLYQLAVASELGLPVPATIVTNRRRDAQRFIRDVGETVVKPVRYGLVSSQRRAVAFTRVVAASEFDRLAGSPVILQARVPAGIHLRVVTVGKRSFLSALTTSALDWRSDASNHDRFRRVGAQSFLGVARDALRIAERLDLGFSSQDWTVDVHDRPWFLEANPNGQWLFLDRPHKGAITSALATELERLLHE